MEWCQHCDDYPVTGISLVKHTISSHGPIAQVDQSQIPCRFASFSGLKCDDPSSGFVSLRFFLGYLNSKGGIRSIDSSLDKPRTLNISCLPKPISDVIKKYPYKTKVSALFNSKDIQFLTSAARPGEDDLYIFFNYEVDSFMKSPKLKQNGFDMTVPDISDLELAKSTVRRAREELPMDMSTNPMIVGKSDDIDMMKEKLMQYEKKEDMRKFMMENVCLKAGIRASIYDLNQKYLVGSEGSLKIKLSQAELKNFVALFDDITNVPAKGADFEDVHYVVPRVEESLIFGTQEGKGFYAVRTKSAVLIVAYEGSDEVAAQVRKAVEDMQAYLANAGY